VAISRIRTKQLQLILRTSRYNSS